jgi:hypothetical protein
MDTTQQAQEARLRDVAGYSAQIRQLEEQRAVIAEKRRLAAIRHWNTGEVTLTALAKAMGVSQPMASKIVHEGPSARASRRTKVGA